MDLTPASATTGVKTPPRSGKDDRETKMGMTFYAGKLDAEDILGPVLEGDEHTMDVSLWTGYDLTAALGYTVDEEGFFEAPIDEFIARGEEWRKSTGADEIAAMKAEQKRWLEETGGGIVSNEEPMIWIPKVDRFIQLAIDGKAAGATVMTGA